MFRHGAVSFVSSDTADSSQAVKEFRPEKSGLIDVFTVSNDFSAKTTYTINYNTVAPTGALLQPEGLSFSVGDLTPKFDPFETSYSLFVPEGTRSVQVTCNPVNPEAECRVGLDGTAMKGGGTSDFTLKTGSSFDEMMVTVTTKNDERTYVVVVFWGEMGAAINQDLLLANLTVWDESLQQVELNEEFHPYRLTYSAYLEKNQSYIVFKPLAFDEGVTVTVDEVKVVDGHSEWIVAPRCKVEELKVRVTKGHEEVVYIVSLYRKSPWYACTSFTEYLSFFAKWANIVLSLSNPENLIDTAKFLQFITLIGSVDNLPDPFVTFSEGFEDISLKPPSPEDLLKEQEEIFLQNEIEHSKEAQGGGKWEVASVVASAGGFGLPSVSTAAEADARRELGMGSDKRRLDARNFAEDSDSYDKTFSHGANEKEEDALGASSYSAASLHVGDIDLDEVREANRLGIYGAVKPNHTSFAAYKEVSKDMQGVHEKAGWPEKSTEVDAPSTSKEDEEGDKGAEYLEYLINVVFLTLGFAFITVVYIVIFFSAINKRRIHPAAWKPGPFWIFVLDFGLIMYTQAAAYLVFSTQGDMTFGAFTIRAGLVRPFCAVMLFLYPLGSLLAAAIILYYYAPKLGDDTDKGETDPKTGRADTSHRYIVWESHVRKYMDKFVEYGKGFKEPDWAGPFANMIPGLFTQAIDAMIPVRPPKRKSIEDQLAEKFEDVWNSADGTPGLDPDQMTFSRLRVKLMNDARREGKRLDEALGDNTAIQRAKDEAFEQWKTTYFRANPSAKWKLQYAKEDSKQLVFRQMHFLRGSKCCGGNAAAEGLEENEQIDKEIAQLCSVPWTAAAYDPDSSRLKVLIDAEAYNAPRQFPKLKTTSGSSTVAPSSGTDSSEKEEEVPEGVERPLPIPDLAIGLYGKSLKEVNNRTLMQDYADAAVAFKRFRVKNTYDRQIEIELTIEAQHIDQALTKFRDLQVQLPVEHLQQKTTDTWGAFYQKSTLGKLYFFILRRLTVGLSICGLAFLSGMHHAGPKQLLLFATVSGLTLVFELIAGFLATLEKTRMKEKQKFNFEMDEEVLMKKGAMEEYLKSGTAIVLPLLTDTDLPAEDIANMEKIVLPNLDSQLLRIKSDGAKDARREEYERLGMEGEFEKQRQIGYGRVLVAFQVTAVKLDRRVVQRNIEARVVKDEYETYNKKLNSRSGFDFDCYIDKHDLPSPMVGHLCTNSSCSVPVCFSLLQHVMDSEQSEDVPGKLMEGSGMVDGKVAPENFVIWEPLKPCFVWMEVKAKDCKKVVPPNLAAEAWRQQVKDDALGNTMKFSDPMKYIRLMQLGWIRFGEMSCWKNEQANKIGSFASQWLGGEAATMFFQVLVLVVLFMGHEDVGIIEVELGALLAMIFAIAVMVIMNGEGSIEFIKSLSQWVAENGEEFKSQVGSALGQGSAAYYEMRNYYSLSMCRRRRCGEFVDTSAPAVKTVEYVDTLTKRLCKDHSGAFASEFVANDKHVTSSSKDAMVSGLWVKRYVNSVQADIDLLEDEIKLMDVELTHMVQNVDEENRGLHMKNVQRKRRQSNKVRTYVGQLSNLMENGVLKVEALNLKDKPAPMFADKGVDDLDLLFEGLLLSGGVSWSHKTMADLSLLNSQERNRFRLYKTMTSPREVFTFDPVSERPGVEQVLPISLPSHAFVQGDKVRLPRHCATFQVTNHLMQPDTAIFGKQTDSYTSFFCDESYIATPGKTVMVNKTIPASWYLRVQVPPQKKHGKPDITAGKWYELTVETVTGEEYTQVRKARSRDSMDHEAKAARKKAKKAGEEDEKDDKEAEAKREALKKFNGAPVIWFYFPHYAMPKTVKLSDGTTGIKCPGASFGELVLKSHEEPLDDRIDKSIAPDADETVFSQASYSSKAPSTRAASERMTSRKALDRQSTRRKMDGSTILTGQSGSPQKGTSRPEWRLSQGGGLSMYGDVTYFYVHPNKEDVQDTLPSFPLLVFVVSLLSDLLSFFFSAFGGEKERELTTEDWVPCKLLYTEGAKQDEFRVVPEFEKLVEDLKKEDSATSSGANRRQKPWLAPIPERAREFNRMSAEEKEEVPAAERKELYRHRAFVKEIWDKHQFELFTQKQVQLKAAEIKQWRKKLDDQKKGRRASLIGAASLPAALAGLDPRLDLPQNVFEAVIRKIIELQHEHKQDQKAFEFYATYFKRVNRLQKRLDFFSVLELLLSSLQKLVGDDMGEVQPAGCCAEPPQARERKIEIREVEFINAALGRLVSMPFADADLSELIVMPYEGGPSLTVGQKMFKTASQLGFRSLDAPFHSDELAFADLPEDRARLLRKDVQKIAVKYLLASMQQEKAYADWFLNPERKPTETWEDYMSRNQRRYEPNPAEGLGEKDLMREDQYPVFKKAVDDMQKVLSKRKETAVESAQREFKSMLQKENFLGTDRQFVHVPLIPKSRVKKATVTFAGETMMDDWEGQMLKWDKQWDEFIENEISVKLAEDEAEAELRHSNQIKGEFRNQLRSIATRAEAQDRGVFKTALHFLCPSSHLKHGAMQWHPDVVRACPAQVKMRFCSETGEAKVDTNPVWYPCELKLTGNKFKFIFHRMEPQSRRLQPGRDEEEDKPVKVPATVCRSIVLDDLEVVTTNFAGVTLAYPASPIMQVKNAPPRSVEGNPAMHRITSWSGRYEAILLSTGQMQIQEVDGWQDNGMVKLAPDDPRKDDDRHITPICVPGVPSMSGPTGDGLFLSIRGSLGLGDLTARQNCLLELVDAQQNTYKYADFPEGGISGLAPFRLVLVELEDDPFAATPCAALAVVDANDEVLWSSPRSTFGNNLVTKGWQKQGANIMTLFVNQEQTPLEHPERFDKCFKVDSVGHDQVPDDPTERYSFDTLLSHGTQPANIIHIEEPGTEKQRYASRADMMTVCFPWDREHAEIGSWRSTVTESSWPAIQVRLPLVDWLRYKSVIEAHRMGTPKRSIDGYQGRTAPLLGYPDCHIRHGQNARQIFFLPKTEEELREDEKTRQRLAKYEGDFKWHVFHGTGKFSRYAPPEGGELYEAKKRKDLTVSQKETLLYSGMWKYGKRHNVVSQDADGNYVYGSPCYQRLEIPVEENQDPDTPIEGNPDRGVYVYRYVGNFRHDFMVGDKVTITLDLDAVRGTDQAVLRQSGSFFGKFDVDEYRRLEEIREELATEARAEGEDPNAVQMKRRLPLATLSGGSSNVNRAVVDIKERPSDRSVIVYYKGKLVNHQLEEFERKASTLKMEGDEMWRQEEWKNDMLMDVFDDSMWTSKAKLSKNPKLNLYQVAYTQDALSYELFLKNLPFTAPPPNHEGAVGPRIVKPRSSVLSRGSIGDYSGSSIGGAGGATQTMHRDLSTGIGGTVDLPPPFCYMTSDNAEIMYADGTVYEGPIVKGRASGKGKITTHPHKKGDEFALEFDGYFKNGVPHSPRDEPGVLTELPLQDGKSRSIWRGPVKNGMRHGQGEALLDYGKVTIRGDFVNDEPKDNFVAEVSGDLSKKSGIKSMSFTTGPNGEKIANVTYTDGSSFKGATVGGKKNGKGTFVQQSERGKFVLDGEWKDDVLDGPGSVAIEVDGQQTRTLFSGTFKEGKPVSGTQFFDGNPSHFFRGSWANGKRNGPGEYSRADGCKYRGNFKDDLPNDPKGQWVEPEDKGGQGKKKENDEFTPEYAKSGTYSFVNGMRSGRSVEQEAAYDKAKKDFDEKLAGIRCLKCRQNNCKSGPSACCKPPPWSEHPPEQSEVSDISVRCPRGVEEELSAKVKATSESGPELRYIPGFAGKDRAVPAGAVFEYGKGLWKRHMDDIPSMDERRETPMTDLRSRFSKVMNEHDKLADFEKFQRAAKDEQIRDTQQMLQGAPAAPSGKIGSGGMQMKAAGGGARGKQPLAV
uniref:Cadherin-like beta-sandwich-like domain-containing protein n=1 Tax=Chromera velia CCMP2878 TaxID=1169474 RepID=A0A0G4IEY0_9ALVE|eukprot:Cvel_13888.t1-p1 / transcript=Cvel_13888.t1 / gene=Cvel_13888 / organism=Chromera_velia_CCMP2878 / gene_product=Radial spoke head 1 homolog, putative / transcript_product=Radial spoke head 1 homolog, putative / location=Cvel_scaffold967:10849-40496(-) / protein_length=3866 / sequence_SO=supercontig / SO=protein_coding / is_pseudo=false